MIHRRITVLTAQCPIKVSKIYYSRPIEFLTIISQYFKTFIICNLSNN